VGLLHIPSVGGFCEEIVVGEGNLFGGYKALGVAVVEKF
jgi:hypothetical protein